MSLEIIASELDRHLIDSYPDKNNISLDDNEFSSVGKDTWIAASYLPITREVIGTNNRIEAIGLYTVRCYAEYRTPCLAVTTTITNIFDEKSIGNNISVEVGEVSEIINLEGNLWEATVNFKVTQS